VTAFSIPSQRRPLIAYLAAIATVMLCAGLMTVAVLEPAPLAVLPVIVLVAIGLPMAIAYELARTGVTGPRAEGEDDALGRRHLTRLRRQLERLPETEHPFEP
jgi:hypothetical protein